jgi:hypothetical protein
VPSPSSFGPWAKATPAKTVTTNAATITLPITFIHFFIFLSPLILSSVDFRWLFANADYSIPANFEETLKEM